MSTLINDLNCEEWRDVPGYEGYYQVSSLGRVKSLDCLYITSKGRKTTNKECIRKLVAHTGGYQTIVLCVDQTKRRFYIHRLVATCFIEKPIGKNVVNHKNAIKTDNRVENLEWCTPGENIQHSVENKLNNCGRGERQGKSKLKDSDILEIRKLKGIITTIRVAKLYGVSDGTISQIQNYKSWTHI